MPGGLTRAAVLLFACTVLTEEVERLVQDAPQRVEARMSYEWCVDQWGGKAHGLHLVRRRYWVVDGKSLRNERADTPASQSEVLWSRPTTP